MNKIYKSKWCESTGTFVAVSELAGRSGKRSSVCVSSSAVERDEVGGIERNSLTLHPLALAVAAFVLLMGAGLSGTPVYAQAAVKDEGATATAPVTNGQGSTAVGNATIASGLSSTAIGDGASAAGGSSVSIGSGSAAAGTSGIALGDSANAGSGLNAIAVGAGSSASGGGGLAVGSGANAVFGNDVAFGTNAFASGSVDATAPSTAFGNAAYAANGSTAFGTLSIATGHISTAFGYAAQATAENSLAVGTGANALNNRAVAIGSGANATGAFSIALGRTAAANGTGAIAIGSMDNATGIATTAPSAGGDESIAIGTSSVAGGLSAIAQGFGANAGTFANAVAIGTTAQALADSGIAMGLNAQSGATGQNVAIGTGAAANSATAGGGAVSIGLGNKATGDGAVAIGDPNIANGTGAIAMGFNSIASSNGTMTGGPANGAVAMGNAAIAAGQGSVSIGNTSQANNVGALAFGDAAISNGRRSIALGNLTNALTASDVAIGDSAVTGTPATNSNGANVAIGFEAHATSLFGNSIAIGTTSLATGGNGVAVGFNATSTGSNATAVGNAANASGTGANAFGGAAKATGDNTLALGSSSKAGGNGAVSIGNAAQASAANSVALGSGSTTKSDLTAEGYNPGSAALSGTASAANGEVSVGGAGTERRVTNVAAGAVATDAVNVSQLQSEDAKVNGVGAGTAASLGGGSTYDPATGTVTQPSYNVGGQTFNDVGGALTNLDGRTTQNTTDITHLTTQLGDTNSQLADAVKYDNADHTSVTLGGMGAKAPVALTNVAPGALSTTSTDAVNGAQLNATNQNVADNTKDIAGNTTSITRLGDTVNNINNGGGIKYFHANSTLADSSATGTDAVAIGGNAQATAQNSVALGSGSTTKSDLTVGGYNPGSAALSGTASVANGEVSVGGAGTERRVTNVAAGAAATDAVNVSQLQSEDAKVNSVGAGTAASLGGGAAYDPATGTFTQPSYTVGDQTFNNVGSALTNLDGRTTQNTTDITHLTTQLGDTNSQLADTVKYDNTDHTSVTLGGTGAKAPVALTNVAPGALTSTSTDAVNGAQLNATNQNVSDNTNDIAGNTTSITKLGDTLDNINNGGGIKYFHANSTLADSSATGTDAVAIGGNAQATAQNSVALGSGSTTKSDLTVAGYNPGSAALSGTASVANGEVSVGGMGTERRVTNVAAGAAATDAVNVSQLQSEDAKVNGVGTGTAASLGGGSTYDPATGTFTQPSYNVGGQTFNNVGGALTNLDGRTTQNTTDITHLTTQLGDTNSELADTVKYDNSDHTSVTLGGTGAKAPVALTNVAPGALTSASTDAVNGAQLNATNQNVADNTKNIAGNTTSITNLGDTVNNITNGGGIKYFHANSTLVDSSATGTDAVAIGGNAQATAGNSVALGSGSTTKSDLTVAGYNPGQTALSGTASTANGEVSVGGAGTERRVTNVAAGAAATDAVNVSQLQSEDAKVNSVGAGTAASLGGGSAYDPATGTFTQPSYTVGDQTFNNVGSALTNIDGRTTQNTTDITHLTTQLGDTNSQLADTVTYDNADHTSVTLGGAGAAPVTLTNVAPGALSSTSTDAVNGAQLNTTNQNVADNTKNIAGNTTSITKLGDTVNNINNGGGIKYFHANSTLADSSATGADAVAMGGNAQASAANSVALGSGSTTKSDLTVAGYNPGQTALSGTASTANGEVSVGGTGTERRVTNVAAGASATDAVNVSQLQSEDAKVNGVGTGTAASLGGGSTYDPATGTFTQPSYTVGDQTFNNVGSALTNIDGRTTQNTTDITHLNTQLGDTTSQLADTVKYDNADHSSVTLGGTGAKSPVALTNVAPGALTPTSTDAVNGAQLNTTNQNVANNTEDIAGNTTSITKLGDTVNNINNGGGIKYFHTNSTLADSSATGTDAVAIGGNAQATVANSVALGSNSVANGLTLNAAAFLAATGNIAGTVPIGEVSVGAAGAERRITNLAAGAADTDAVNVSQLKQVAGDVSQLGNRAVQYDLNPDSSLNLAGITLAGTTSLDGGLTGGTKISNLAQGDLTATSTDAVNGSQLYATNLQVATNTSNITQLTGRVTTIEGELGDIGVSSGMFRVSPDDKTPPPAPTGSNSAAGGAGAVASGANSLAVGNGSNASASNSTALGTNAQAGQSGDVALGAGAVANRGAESYVGKYSGAENNSVGTVSVGDAATGQTRTISNVADGQNATDAVNVRQLTGAVQQANSYTDTQIHNTLGAINTGSAGMFQVSQDNTAAPVASGANSAAGGAGALASGSDSTAVGNGSKASGSQSTAMGNGAQATADGSVALGQGSIADRANTVSVGSKGAERQVVNVAAGTLSATSTDAVNGAQLNTTNTTVDNIVQGKAGLVQQASPSAPVTVANQTGGSVITVNGVDGDRRISGVADGQAPNDAANLNQLNNLGQSMTQQVNRLDGRVSDVENHANAGIAAALATAGLPQAYLPGKSMFSIGGGAWNGQTGIAVGLSTVSDNGKWIMKGTFSSSSRGDYGGSVGVGYQW